MNWKRVAGIFVLWVVGTTALLAHPSRSGSAGVEGQDQPAAVPPAEGAGIVEAPVPIELLVGRSTVIDVGVPITRVSLTTADVADGLMIKSKLAQPFLVNPEVIQPTATKYIDP